MPGGCGGSAFTECLSSQFVNVLVVADANALSGRKIGPVADHIALISIAQFKTLDTCDSAPAKQDMGYLKALYAGPSSLKFWLQKSELTEHMARARLPGR